jgi:glycosyltransferase involved in cell wall biosynthesis
VLPRVLIVHNRYREFPSGENQVVDGQIALLRDAGVEVETYIRSSDEIASYSRSERVELCVRPIYSRVDIAGVDRVIQSFRPDVVHLHNVYPLISPAIVPLAKSRGCRVVQTVHNFRHICVAGIYSRDGATCTDCLGKRYPWPAVMHGCYRGSRAQSVALATAIAYHRKTWRLVDRFLPVSEFVAGHLAIAGIPWEQMRVVPNSVSDPGPATALGHGFLFAGRLANEKGVGLLLRAWERSALGQDTDLTIAGDGPERSAVERAAAQLAGVRYAGAVSSKEVRQLIRESHAVVVPSVSFEALPTVVLESYSCGRPIVATRGGPFDALVPADVGWLAYPDETGVAAALKECWCDPSAATKGERARALYSARFSPSGVLGELLSAYRDVTDSPRFAPKNADQK